MHRDPSLPVGDHTADPERRRMWDERHAAREPIESTEPDPTLAAVVAELRPGTALDLGSGDGRNAVWLAQAGWTVTGADFSVVALERAAARAAREGVSVDWVQRDLLAWTPDAAAYDLVTLFFIHLPAAERRGVYARAAAAVAPGGTLLVVAHDRTNLAHGVGGPQDPDVLFTAAEAAAELPAGFEVVRAEATRRGAGEDAGARAPIDAVMVARRAG